MRPPVTFGLFNIFKSERISTVKSMLIKFPDVDRLGK